MLGCFDEARRGRVYLLHLPARLEALVQTPSPGVVVVSPERKHLVEVDRSILEGSGAQVPEIAALIQRYERQRFVLTSPRSRLELRVGAPVVVGILNATPDSFSDGGLLSSPARRLEAIETMIQAGCRWIDIGGESSRPGAEPIAAAEELERLLPPVEEVRRRSAIWISVDTTKACVARAAVEAGADMVNDISAARLDPAMLATCVEMGVGIVLNHMRGTPRTMQVAPHYRDPLEEVGDDLLERVACGLNTGLPAARIILDPGIGFGKRFEDNIALIRHLHELRGCGHALMVGASRKSFLGEILASRKPIERDAGTSATTAHLVRAGAAAIRVHDVQRAIDVVRVVQAIAGEDQPRGWFDR